MRKAIYYTIAIYGLIRLSMFIFPSKDNYNTIPDDMGDPVIAPKKDTFKFNKPDTTPYKGNWIDIN